MSGLNIYGFLCSAMFNNALKTFLVVVIGQTSKNDKPMRLIVNNAYKVQD